MSEVLNDLQDAELTFIPPRLETVFAFDDLLTTHELIEGIGAPPYFRHALSLDSHFHDLAQQAIAEGTLTNEQYESQVEVNNFMLVHALIRADDFVMTKYMLGTVKNPTHKVALFEAALVLKNMAGAEVLAVYDMGKTLEEDLQITNDFENLSKVMMLKITAGIDVYTSSHKLEALLSLIPHYSYDMNIGKRMVGELLARGDTTTAMRFAERCGLKHQAQLMHYLLHKGKVDNAELEPLLSEILNHYTSGSQRFIRKMLKKSKLEFDGTAWHDNLSRIDTYNARVQEDLDFIKSLKAGDTQPKFMVITSDDNLSRNVDFLVRYDFVYAKGGVLAHQALPKDGNTAGLVTFFDQKLLAYTDPRFELSAGSSIDITRALYVVACELVATNTTADGDNSTVADIFGKLAVLEAERQPSVQHYHKTDFYSRSTSEQAACIVLENSIEAVSSISSPLQQHDALQRIIDSTYGGWFDLSYYRTKAEHLLEINNKRLQHPLLKSIIGME